MLKILFWNPQIRNFSGEDTPSPPPSRLVPWALSNNAPPPPPLVTKNLATALTFHSKNPGEYCANSKVYGTLIMKCPKCFWHGYYKICPIYDHQIPEERNYIEEGFLHYRPQSLLGPEHENKLSSVARLWSNYTQKREDVGNQSLSPF